MSIRDVDIERTFALSSTLNFTRYMFKQKTGNKFIVGDHHQKICDALDKVVKGEITRLIINIAPRYGKAIDSETPMFTADGWKKASDVKIGDYLFGSNGKQTKVLGVYPQGVTDAYKVTFSDGTNLVTCGEHLWALDHRDLSRKDGFTFQQIRKTKELIGTLYANDGHKMWSIPMVKPLEPEKRQRLPIDPYLLGCWLGDGSTYKAEITTPDDEIRDAFSEYGTTVRTHQNAGKATTYGITGGFVTKMKELGVYRNKHIPVSYLMASREDRFALLQGLCDTDGTANKINGQTSVCSTNPTLKRDIKTLIASLGYYYTEKEYSVFFRADECPFRLQRKAQYWKPATRKHHTKRFITNIERVEERETVCFTVDALDHLFCAGEDFIVTHNTELAVKNFIAYGLALNPKSKFIHLSYSDDLVLDSSKEINNVIRSDYYQRLFPEAKTDSTNAKKWYTNAGGGMYAVSSAGQVTGFGAGQVDDPERLKELEGKDIEDFMPAWDTDFAGAIIIDDPIKPEDALSDTVRERVNNRFETTIRNRVNSRNTPIIIVMQRLHEHDLCGYLQEIEPDEWTVISLPCITYDEDGNEKPLWEFKHTLEELRKIEAANSFVFGTQYMQNPTPLEGLLYREFRTYETIPFYNDSERKNYTDTADTGNDYLCSICYVDTPVGNYVTDVLYTKKPMEFTEPATAEMLTINQTEWADVESNGSGRSFARNVEKECRQMGNTGTFINWFAQTGNKRVRIFTKSADVNNMTFFPVGWEHRWPEFHQAITKFRKEGGNANDDAPDALTGCFEKRKVRVGKVFNKSDLGIF